MREATVFWDVTPCALMFSHDDGSMFLRNVVICTVSSQKTVQPYLGLVT
jgi:hypothetical protein